MGPVEFTQKTLPFDNNLEAELKKMEAEGWQLMQGVMPTITYVLWRAQAQPQSVVSNQGYGSITIDDSKVHIIKGGG